MQDFVDRETLLVLIVAVVAIIALPLAGWHARKAHVRRLRMRGDPRVKRREAERRRQA